MNVRMGSLGVFIVLLSAGCEPTRPKPLPATRLPSVEEIAGRYAANEGIWIQAVIADIAHLINA